MAKPDRPQIYRLDIDQKAAVLTFCIGILTLQCLQLRRGKNHMVLCPSGNSRQQRKIETIHDTRKFKTGAVFDARAREERHLCSHLGNCTRHLVFAVSTITSTSQPQFLLPTQLAQEARPPRSGSLAGRPLLLRICRHWRTSMTSTSIRARFAMRTPIEHRVWMRYIRGVEGRRTEALEAESSDAQGCPSCFTTSPLAAASMTGGHVEYAK